QLFVRRLDRAETREVPGSGGSQSAAFSPDSANVVFVPGSTAVARVSLADQHQKIVASGADLTAEITWSAAGIIFSRNGALWIVPPEGGAARALTTLDAARHEVFH